MVLCVIWSSACMYFGQIHACTLAKVHALWLRLRRQTVAALLLLLARFFALEKRFAQLPSNVHLQTMVEFLTNPSGVALRGPTVHAERSSVRPSDHPSAKNDAQKFVQV